jgi:hypothetical protein
MFRVVEGEGAMQPGSRAAFGVPLDLVDTSEVCHLSHNVFIIHADDNLCFHRYPYI